METIDALRSVVACEEHRDIGLERDRKLCEFRSEGTWANKRLLSKGPIARFAAECTWETRPGWTVAILPFSFALLFFLRKSFSAELKLTWETKK